MREILFRGKQIDDGEWVYGLLCYNTYNQLCIQPIEDFPCCVIDPETVGQYTGLTINGIKVYEGDIVAYDHTIRTYSWDEIPETYKPRRSYSVAWNENLDELNYKRNYAVEWKEKEARWILRNGSDQHDLRRISLSMHNGVVIGNIHDNPELLKGGAE